MEHTTESTERDIAWLDRLIEAERARDGAPAGPPAFAANTTARTNRTNGTNRTNRTNRTVQEEGDSR